MRKIFILLCLAIYVLGLTACNNAEETDKENASLNVWAIESTLVDNFDYATNKQSVWMEEATGIKINYISSIAGSWYNDFKASIMNEDDIDIYCYPFSTTEVSMLSQMNYIVPLEDYITPENTPNIYAILEANPELRDLITAPDEHIYTLFSYNTYNLNAFTQKLWVNRLFLEKYTSETGKGLPSTTDEFTEMLTYFAEHDMNGDGKLNEIPYIGNAGVDGFYHLYGSFIPSNSSGNGFGCYINDENQLTFAYNKEAYREALLYIKGLYDKGLISPDTFTISPSERYTYTSGDCNMVRAGVVSGVTSSQVVQLSDNDNTMTYSDYIPLPPLEGPNGVRTIVSTGETSISLCNAITKHCDDISIAMSWLDKGYSEEARLFAIYGGLENIDWAYADGKTLNGPAQVIVSYNESNNNISWGDRGIVSITTENDYLMMDSSNIATNDALSTYQANATAYRPYMVKNPWPPIVWAGDSYTEEAAAYTELNNLISKTVTEYYTDVIIGNKNLDGDWDAYIKELNEIGVERFVDLCELYMTATEKE